MQDMLGKVPNKANTLWKVIMRVSVVLLVFALLISLWAYSKLVGGRLGMERAAGACGQSGLRQADRQL